MTWKAGGQITASVGVALGLVISMSGCALLDPAARVQSDLRISMADAIEDSQDTIWDFRRELRADAEATLGAVSGLVDARPAFADPAANAPSGSYTLIRLSEDSDSTDLTFIRSSSTTSGGSFWYSTSHAVTCYTLVIAADASQISTVPSDCTDADGIDRTAFLSDGDNPNLIALGDLDVRLHVDESDYRALACQCSSGGTCDCPGG